MAPKSSFLSTAFILPFTALAFQPIGNQVWRTNTLPNTFGLDTASVVASNRYSSSALSAAKKKRRRRKNTSQSIPQEREVNNISDAAQEIDELPDFDLDEEQELMSKSKVSASSMSDVGVAPTNLGKSAPLDANDPLVVEAMKATKGAPGEMSTKDLLRSRNRDLEQKFVVNEVTTEVPSLADYAAKKSGTSNIGSSQGTMGKKAARKEARRAAAIEAANKEEEGNAINDILSILPFVDKTEPGEKKSSIKVSSFL